MKAANISESRSKNTTDYHRHTDTLCCLNSVKLYLHVTASKIQLIVHTFLKLVYNSNTYILVYLNGNNAAEGENNIKNANSYP